MILGPALGRLLAVHGTTLPLLLAAGLCLLNALLAGLFLEETLPRRDAAAWIRGG